MSGKVKVGQCAADGRENLQAVLGPDDVFGELAVFDAGPRTSTVTALTDVVAITVTRDQMRGYLRERPDVADELLGSLARRLRDTNDAFSDLVFSDVPARVASLLVHLGRKFGVQDGDHLRVQHDLTQVEIAQLIGSSRETVNKALTDFVERGWIRTGGKTTWIIDGRRLAARAR